MLEKICLTTEKLFMKYGIKSITMDDVAKELSISKKTLYQFVKDKNELVQHTIMSHINTIDCLSDQLINKENNAIHQILNIAEMVIQIHKDVNPTLIYDLKKFHAETYELFKQHRENNMFEKISDNLKLGIEQNLFRSDLNIPLTTGFYMGLIDLCLSDEIQSLAQTPFTQKFTYMISYHLNAICTPQGKQFMSENATLLNQNSF
jgi:AcrR family transcriptional regulator